MNKLLGALAIIGLGALIYSQYTKARRLNEQAKVKTK